MSVETVGIIKLILLGLVVVAAGVLTTQAAKGQGVGLWLAKFFGIFVSTIPIVGFIQWLAFKAKAAGYSKACGTQAVVGLIWYAAVTFGFKAG